MHLAQAGFLKRIFEKVLAKNAFKNERHYTFPVKNNQINCLTLFQTYLLLLPVVVQLVLLVLHFAVAGELLLAVV